jgi:hypothetical protein
VVHDGGVGFVIFCVGCLCALLIYAFASAVGAGGAVERWHGRLDQLEVQLAQTRKKLAELRAAPR